MDNRDPQTYAVIGAAIEVHNELGCGFLEVIYQEALAIELAIREIPFRREVAVTPTYKDRPLTATYRMDFICFDSIVVELKALQGLGNIEDAQLLNYLKATGLSRGLLLNFGQSSLQQRRLVRNHHQ